MGHMGQPASDQRSKQLILISSFSYFQEDGYYSEGGSSFYARKIQSRIAMEKQKTAEEQRKKLVKQKQFWNNKLRDHS